MGGKFFFPPVRDITHVPSNNIVYVLSKPTEQGLTKRQKSYFAFGINFHSIINYKSEYARVIVCMICHFLGNIRLC
jgi:hypothetical protein